jgi:hypothetical protein
LQVSCGDFGRRRTFALSWLIEKPNWGEFVTDCCGPDPFDRFFEHKVRSEKRLTVRQIAAPQSALRAHKLCYGQSPERTIARRRRGRAGSAPGNRHGEFRIGHGDKHIVDVEQKATSDAVRAIARMKSVSLMVDSRKDLGRRIFEQKSVDGLRPAFHRRDRRHGAASRRFRGAAAGR